MTTPRITPESCLDSRSEAAVPTSVTPIRADGDQKDHQSEIIKS